MSEIRKVDINMTAKDLVDAARLMGATITTNQQASDYVGRQGGEVCDFVIAHPSIRPFTIGVNEREGKTTLSADHMHEATSFVKELRLKVKENLVKTKAQAAGFHVHSTVNVKGKTVITLVR